jgi:hypothetical protein
MLDKSEVGVMDLSQLTQQDMKAIVLYAYKKGNESVDIKAKELINEIKQQIISVIGRN